MLGHVTCCLLMCQIITTPQEAVRGIFKVTLSSCNWLGRQGPRLRGRLSYRIRRATTFPWQGRAGGLSSVQMEGRMPPLNSSWP